MSVSALLVTLLIILVLVKSGTSLKDKKTFRSYGGHNQAQEKLRLWVQAHVAVLSEEIANLHEELMSEKRDKELMNLQLNSVQDQLLVMKENNNDIRELLSKCQENMPQSRTELTKRASRSRRWIFFGMNKFNNNREKDMKLRSAIHANKTKPLYTKHVNPVKEGQMQGQKPDASTVENAIRVGKALRELSHLSQLQKRCCAKMVSIEKAVKLDHLLVKHVTSALEVITRYLPVPGEPNGIELETVNATSLAVHWNAPFTKPKNPIRGYRVYYVQINDNGNPEGQEHSVNVRCCTQIVINDLNPATTYSVEIAGYTRHGEGIRSRSKSLSTAVPVPSAPDSVVVNITPWLPRFLAVWKRPRQMYGRLQSYRLYWGAVGKVPQEIKLSQESFISGPLDEGTTYTFSLAAENEYGLGENVSDVIRTPEYVAGRPRNLNVRTVSPTAVIVAWSAPVRGPSVVDYGFHWYCNDTGSTPVPFYKRFPPDTTSYTLADIVPSSVCYINVVSISAKEQISTRVLRINASELVSTAVRNLDSFVLRQWSPLHAVIYWQPPHGIKGRLLRYRLRWKAIGEEYYNTFVSQEYFVTGTIEYSTVYEFRVAAETDEEIGDFVSITVSHG